MIRSCLMIHLKLILFNIRKRFYNEDTNASIVWDLIQVNFELKIRISDLFSLRVKEAVLTTIMGIAAVGFSARSDTEIFKTKLNRVYFREDYIDGFQALERGFVLLDIEKALNIVEEVAYKHKLCYGRPLILIINNEYIYRIFTG
ncbi:P-loop containing nucleoside triphosphate hydrolase protein [Rhizophagus irregularis DAOM 181602=DAOM 197198]|nr:P-loop containing nucleoside triphosphate hydrolase protein [Rhizophagus irregularis DAOM 181602=DAOM 197198]